MSKADILHVSLMEFFSEPGHVSRALSILKQPQSSLRFIDFLVTVYAREHRVIFCSKGMLVDIYASYKNQLKSFKKQFFDIFRRGSHIKFKLGEEIVDTTLAQLCFVRWLIKFNIDEYYTEHRDDIVKAMASKSERQRTDKRRAATCLPFNVRVQFD
jgi:hypothetical protein